MTSSYSSAEFIYSGTGEQETPDLPTSGQPFPSSSLQKLRKTRKTIRTIVKYCEKQKVQVVHFQNVVFGPIWQVNSS